MHIHAARDGPCTHGNGKSNSTQDVDRYIELLKFNNKP